MRLDDARESENVEDRRGMGGRGFRPGGAGGLGIGGVILLLVISYFLGVDPSQLLNDSGVSTGGEPPASTPAGPPGSDPAGEFAKKNSRGYRGYVDRDFRAFGTAVHEARARAVLRRRGLSMWPGGVGHRSVLLSGRSEGLSRSQFLPGARPAVRCSWRLRAGLRHRPRDWPSRPEPDRQSGERRRAVASRRQCAVGAPGTPGGLSGGRVGVCGGEAQSARAGRRGGRTQGGCRHRRRSPATGESGQGRPGLVHTRLVGGSRGGAETRTADRRRGGMRPRTLSVRGRIV